MPRGKPGTPSLHKPTYGNPVLAKCQERIALGGMDSAKLRDFLVTLHEREHKALAEVSLGDLSPKTVAERILLPRRDLYLFILYNWIKGVFIPSLGETLAEELLVFGVGRIFSAHNDTGVQNCTDADLNFVLSSALGKAKLASLKKAVDGLKKEVRERFGIDVEVDPGFTVRGDAEVAAKLGSDKEARLFYKCNSGGMMVIHDHPPMREAIAAGCAGLSDGLFFTHFLGDNGTKPTLTKLFSDRMPLPIIADDSQERREVRSLIGSLAFRKDLRALSKAHPDLYPGEWHFSIKYTVNRVYDYIRAMTHEGYSLEEIGFGGKEDPDYRFACNVHRLMLYMQELIHMKMDLYNVASDYSYMSSGRFTRLMEIAGEGFRKDFEGMVLEGGILLPSQKGQYKRLCEAVRTKSRDRVVKGMPGQVRALIESHGFQHEKVDEDGNKLAVCVPFTRADIGFYVFECIAERMIAIVDGKFLPALKNLQ